MLFSTNNDAFLHLTAFVIVAIVSAWVVDFELHHPLFFYVSLYSLYSVAYTILCLFGLNSKYGYSKEALLCMWIGLIVIVLIIPIHKIRNGYFLEVKKINDHHYLLMSVTNLLSLWTYLGLFYIMVSGFSHKNEIYSDGGIVINLTCKMVYINMLYITMLLLNSIKYNSINIKCLIFAIFSVVLFGLVTGERDYMFHMMMIIVLSLSFFGKIKKKHLPVLLFLGISAVVLSKSFKYFFLSGSGAESIAQDNLFIDFLSGEFISASRNVQILVNGGYDNYFGGYSLLTDFIRVIYDFDVSTVRWFNDVVLYDVVNTGYGFTIVGEGYVNGGYIGVAFVMLIVGILLRYLYINANNSLYYLTAYIYMLPQFVYATRADITNIISPLLKHVILGFVCLSIIFNLFGKKNRIAQRRTI